MVDQLLQLFQLEPAAHWAACSLCELIDDDSEFTVKNLFHRLKSEIHHQLIRFTCLFWYRQKNINSSICLSLSNEALDLCPHLSSPPSISPSICLHLHFSNVSLPPSLCFDRSLFLSLLFHLSVAHYFKLLLIILLRFIQPPPLTPHAHFYPPVCPSVHHYL